VKKITVLGSHGVGKTTFCYSLCYHYKQKFCNVKLVHETARSCPFPINENATYEAQLWNCLSHLKKELETQARGFDLCICDRSSIDPFVYLRANGIDNPGARRLELFAMDWMNSYDLIVYIKPSPGHIFEVDAIRSADEDFRCRVQDSFDFYVNNFPESLQEKIQVVHSNDIFADVKLSKAVNMVGDCLNLETQPICV
jgi:thymidylate kinase